MPFESGADGPVGAAPVISSSSSCNESHMRRPAAVDAADSNTGSTGRGDVPSVGRPGRHALRVQARDYVGSGLFRGEVGVYESVRLVRGGEIAGYQVHSPIAMTRLVPGDRRASSNFSVLVAVQGRDRSCELG